MLFWFYLSWGYLPLGFPGFVKSKMIDEILEHGQVLDRQVFELHPAAPCADLLPGAFGDFRSYTILQWNLVQVNEKVAAAEYYYFGAPIHYPRL